MKSFQQAIESDAEKTKFRLEAVSKEKEILEEKLRDIENKLKTEITNNQTLDKNSS
jgi:chaperonin cofactor prefoldin